MFQLFLSLPLPAQIILAPILFLNALGLLFVLALIPRGIYVVWQEEREQRRERDADAGHLTPALSPVESVAH